ncbi:arylamine N-acetyltransferase [Frankia sp. R82]|uniref:arylamine N-acetyltransferase family protein n=1 Tax=Frankia sp. R82 TaxID=2950553 RepID=UPI0020444516|nr:arylamine N-acetyltransferase [Frankia sp. R82]MCM3884957.1 arylamine N-acetyltransferase [Frankia sp. R82]
MLDVGQYLAAIGYEGPLDPSLRTLRGLHESHVRAVPYHTQPNDAEFLTGAEFDVVQAFQRSIVSRAGGSCYELNESFRQLLEQLGFTAHRLAASTRLPSGRFGPEIEHLAVLVDLDGEQWIADVGYSEPTSFGPLKITSEVQLQDGFEFRMVPDGEWWLLERLSPVKGWSGLYRFKAVARSQADFAASIGEIAAQLSEWPAANLRILSRVVGNSTVLMTGRRLMKHDVGREESRMVIDQGEYERLTDLILDPELTDEERAVRIKEFYP